MKTERTKEQIEKQIEKNRDGIHALMGVDLPLDIIYFNVRRLSASNERLIKELNDKLK